MLSESLKLSYPVAVSAFPFLIATTPDGEHEAQITSALQVNNSSQASILVGKRVVIVEDEGVTQLQLRRSLNRLGLIVAGVANNGASGVEVVLRERPDIVLMDIKMPGDIDGLEAARQILREYRVCIVVLTAYAVETYQRIASEIGISSYLIKPVVSETLLTGLETAYRSFLQQ